MEENPPDFKETDETEIVHETNDSEPQKLATQNVHCDQQKQEPIRIKIKESLVMKEVIDEFAHEDSQKSFGSNSTVKSPKIQTGPSGSSGKLSVLSIVFQEKCWQHCK